MAFFAKMRGHGQCPPRVPFAEVGVSWLGAVLAMGLVGYLSERTLDAYDVPLMVGSFAASAVLLYGAPRSPLAQPRNVLGGHILSALVGVSFRLALPEPVWLTTALAVATAIALMHLGQMLHPPGGATAFIAVSGGAKITALGFGYVLAPIGTGALILLVVALVVNNLAKGRRYPEYWW